MITFDEITTQIKSVFANYHALIPSLGTIVINRDLYGRVRLILKEDIERDVHIMGQLSLLLDELIQHLSPHIWPKEQVLLFEEEIDSVYSSAPHFALEGFENIFVVDRLATETNWNAITPTSQESAPRVVFFSIKGGVGRSSALAATAWSLAQSGKRVLILDVDLESPGLSTALLPDDKQPQYGIIDWLVEDLVDNADAIFSDMVATSDLSHDGQIYVVPAHGAEAGEYVSKLGRVWMPKVAPNGTREPWSNRLQRLVNNLESKYQPDIILIDSRAGIDEVASSCVTDLGASLILLFSIEGSQTWSGYKILFEHWQRSGVIEDIRERLQIVSAITPDVDTSAYLEQLRDNAYNLFSETQYDEIPAGEVVNEDWNFESTDDTAPHYPLVVNWHRSFVGLSSLHGRLSEIDNSNIQLIFGKLIDSIKQYAQD
ncbi:ParA family protein [Vibrio navarrensis]|uniref:ParA family protein n=1 Tax=Vibrio navarrensis TaxID=29495 RepID=UPI001559F3B2|nr:P-loop NTPase [Vibrio navarrensis]